MNEEMCHRIKSDIWKKGHARKEKEKKKRRIMKRHMTRMIDPCVWTDRRSNGRKK